MISGWRHSAGQQLVAILRACAFLICVRACDTSNQECLHPSSRVLPGPCLRVPPQAKKTRECEALWQAQHGIAAPVQSVDSRAGARGRGPLGAQEHCVDQSQKGRVFLYRRHPAPGGRGDWEHDVFTAAAVLHEEADRRSPRPGDSTCTWVAGMGPREAQDARPVPISLGGCQKSACGIVQWHPGCAAQRSPSLSARYAT